MEEPSLNEMEGELCFLCLEQPKTEKIQMFSNENEGSSLNVYNVIVKHFGQV